MEEDLDVVSERQWWTGHEWLLTLYALQRINMEVKADTERLRQIMGNSPSLRADDGHSVLGVSMAVVQAFAMEKLLKSMWSSEGVNTEEQSNRTHSLSCLYAKKLSKGLRERLTREYLAWVEQAKLALKHAPGEGNPKVLEDLETNLAALLSRHTGDFIDLRYSEAKDGGVRKIDDRLNMFLAVCAAEAVRHQEMLHARDPRERYQLSGTQGKTRNTLAADARTLIMKYMANGGQDLRDAEKTE